jgi:SPP1 gp7 family putative phage head morphogenesis protein
MQSSMAPGTTVAPVPPLEEAVSVPALDEVAGFERSFFNLGPRYNPDKLVAQKGIEIYDRMRVDEQVKAVMNFKRDAITARGWMFSFDEGSKLSPVEQDRRIRVFCKILDGMKGSFLDALNVIATGRDFGFSMTEKVLSQITVDDQSYVGVNMLMGRAPGTFQFYTDEHGILRETWQVAAGRRVPVDMSRYIHYVHSPEFDRYYGRSDLREAYRAWYIKQQIGNYWTLYLERMAGGFVVANRQPDSDVQYNSPEYQSMQAVLRNLHAATGIIPPKGFGIQVIYPASTDAYEKAMVFWDLCIAKALLVPNLLGITHTGQTGAYSQAQTQLEAFFWTLNADAARLEAVINEQLVEELGDQNFGDGDYPDFGFKPASREHILQVINSWAELVGAKGMVPTEDDEAFFRRLLDMPKRTATSKPLVIPQAQGQAPTDTPKGNVGPDIRGKQQGPNDAAYTALREEFKAAVTRIEALTTQALEAARAVEKPPHKAPVIELRPHGKLRTATRAQFDRAVQRVSFAVIERRQDRLAYELADNVAPFVAKAVRKMLGTDSDLKRFTSDDPAALQQMEFSGTQKGQLKEIFRRALQGAWRLGGQLARAELERARGQRMVAMTDLRDNAAGFFEANGFRLAGNVSDGVRALIQQELQNSIKFGRSPPQTRESIWDRLVSRGFTNRESVRETEDDAAVTTALNDLWGADPAQTASYLDTLSRTNLFEAMNEARYAEFTDPNLSGFVQALEYSAVMDDRTTEICTALDGSIYADDSPEWDNYRPPNHYNCRSILIPITTADGWDGQESAPPSVQPQAGFGAGAVQ